MPALQAGFAAAELNDMRHYLSAAINLNRLTPWVSTPDCSVVDADH
jgi:hypothetical protein